MPKYDDWTVLSRYNHVKGLGSRMTKKRSDPNRNLYKISYNYSILEIAIYFQDPTKPSNAQRGHPVGHEESEKDDDEEMKKERERERERERSNRAGARLKTALHRQPHPALPSPCDPAGLPGGGAISGGRIGI